METDDVNEASSPASPVPIDAAGRSYWVVLQAYCDSTPDTSIDSLEIYIDGADPGVTGLTWIAQTATTYIQAPGTPGVAGTLLSVGNYATLTGAPVDPFTWTSGSPKSVSGSIANPGTGAFGNYIVFQAKTSGSQTDGTEITLPDIVIRGVAT